MASRGSDNNILWYVPSRRDIRPQSLVSLALLIAQTGGTEHSIEALRGYLHGGSKRENKVMITMNMLPRVRQI